VVVVRIVAVRREARGDGPARSDGKPLERGGEIETNELRRVLARKRRESREERARARSRLAEHLDRPGAHVLVLALERAGDDVRVEPARHVKRPERTELPRRSFVLREDRLERRACRCDACAVLAARHALLEDATRLPDVPVVREELETRKLDRWQPLEIEAHRPRVAIADAVDAAVRSIPDVRIRVVAG